MEYNFKKCPICGREYIPAANHIYKIAQHETVCSWHCVRDWEKEQEARKRRNAGRKKREVRNG